MSKHCRIGSTFLINLEAVVNKKSVCSCSSRQLIAGLSVTMFDAKSRRQGTERQNGRCPLHSLLLLSSRGRCSTLGKGSSWKKNLAKSQTLSDLAQTPPPLVKSDTFLKKNYYCFFELCSLWLVFGDQLIFFPPKKSEKNLEKSEEKN